MKPLTIDELRNLEVGDWVWIVDELSNIKGYAQVEVSKAIGDKGFIIPTKRSYGFGYYDTYGTKWIAYKNKEQAEAKGEIVELPCNVGVPIYVIRNPICDMSKYGIYKVEYTEISITKEGVKVNEVWDKTPIAMFDTQEEAKVRLQELRGEK